MFGRKEAQWENVLAGCTGGGLSEDRAFWKSDLFSLTLQKQENLLGPVVARRIGPQCPEPTCSVQPSFSLLTVVLRGIQHLGIFL